MNAPTSVRARVYQVGLGDCMLLTIRYRDPLDDGRRERHLLIDFGTRATAPGGPSLARLAPLIAEHCGGQAGGHLDVVVVTNRRADHAAGFGERAATEHLAALAPRLILRPWTDGPATAPAIDGHPIGAASRRFHDLLGTIADHQGVVIDQFGTDGRTTTGRVGRLARLSMANPAAMEMLGTWSTPDPTVWVRAGDEVDTDPLLPGVRIRVLGPPTLEQVPDRMSYASTASEQWLAMADDNLITPALTAATADDVWAARDRVAAPDGLGSAAWLINKMHQAGNRSALEIVAGFDQVLDNTSVVLLVQIGHRNILLAGDAQVESWRSTLDRALGQNGCKAEPELHDALAAVDLYKVGHHGGRNATPRRLVELWSSRRPGHTTCSVLSTRSGVVDETLDGPMPKRELVNALEALGPVHSTALVPTGVWWFDLDAKAQVATATWRYSNGPALAPTSPEARHDNDE